MAGARALSKEEHLKVKESFTTLRNKCLYLLGKNTGFRLSELLCIYVRDVYKKDYVKVQRKNLKGKTESREVVLNKEAKIAIEEYLNSLDIIDLDSPLFISRKFKNESIKRSMAHKILKQAFKEANLQGSVSSHTMRKSFSLNVYEKSGNDLVLTSKALGHRWIATTMKYLPVNQERLDNIIKDEE